MKKLRLFKPLALLGIAALLLTSCGSPQPEENNSTSSMEPDAGQESVHNNQLSENESHPNLAVTYSVSSMEELRALRAEQANATVYLRGYYEPGDGGGGSFYWDAESQLPDDGGTVIQPEGVETGRFIRLCEPNHRNVKWFGAVGSGKKDDYEAIQAAIDSLPQNGGTVVLPGGTYAVTKTIQIGNGNGGETFSNQNAVKLVGQGGGFAVTGDAIPTTIVAASGMADLIRVNGRISDLLFQDLCLSGNNQAQVCLSMTAFSGTTLRDVRIQQFSRIGLEIMGGEEPVGNYNISNRFETVQIVASMDNTTCLLMDGVYSANNDTWLTVFNNCSFDTGSCAGATGAWFRFVDSNSFYRCQFGGSGEGSVGIVFDATANHDFPCGMAFYDCSVSSTQVLEDESHQIRKNYFYGYCTANGEELPTHNRLIGITDTGVPFNMEELTIGGGGTNSGGSGLPAKRGAVDTYTAAEYNHLNLAETGDEVGIRFNAGGTFRGATFYMPNYDNNLGSATINVYKWDTDYRQSKAGEVLYSVTFENFDNNIWNRFEMAEGLPAGEYLLTITATAPEGDAGCGVWTKGKTAVVETYHNGYLAEFGLVGQILID